MQWYRCRDGTDDGSTIRLGFPTLHSTQNVRPPPQRPIHGLGGLPSSPSIDSASRRSNDKHATSSYEPRMTVPYLSLFDRIRHDALTDTQRNATSMAA